MSQLPRQATIERNTKETQFASTLVLDGRGDCSLDTPVPFLNHMLHAWAHHGRFDPSRDGPGRRGH